MKDEKIHISYKCINCKRLSEAGYLIKDEDYKTDYGQNLIIDGKNAILYEYTCAKCCPSNKTTDSL